MKKEIQIKQFQAGLIVLFGFLFIRDHGGIRTHTPLRAPAPQAGKSTVSPRGRKLKKPSVMLDFICDPTGARTQDPIIKSDVLYQLSYRVCARSYKN